MLYVAISDLNPAVYNPRKWSKKATDDLTDSIKRFGLIDPIIVNKARGNTVVGGHFRLHVAKKLGYTEVPCVFVSIEDERQEKELNLRLNKNSGDWDWSLLKDWETSLLQEAGFDDTELKEMMDQVLEPVKEDDFDPTATLEAKETKVKLGEVWQLGTHRLMCGDSTKLEDVEKLMDGKKADMVFTDPPYGVDYTGGIQFTNRGVKKEQQNRLENDDTADIYLKAVPMMAMFCDGPIYTWFAATKAQQLYEAINLVGGKIHAMIVWVKNGGYGALNACYKQKHEPCLFWKVSGNLRWIGATNECTIWEIDKDGRNKLHPTQKPIELCARALLNHSAKSCLDLFAGSGSTLIACEQTKRICYTMELDPKYCDVVIARWEKLTNQTAIKL